MSLFKLHSEYNLSGDQGKAVSGLLSGLAAGKMSQVLRGQNVYAGEYDQPSGSSGTGIVA